MKILVINPNTSECFNKLLKDSSDKYALSSTHVKIISPKSGPEVIGRLGSCCCVASASLLVYVLKLWKTNSRSELVDHVRFATESGTSLKPDSLLG